MPGNTVGFILSHLKHALYPFLKPLCLKFWMLLDISCMCIETKYILSSGCALYMFSTVDQLSFNLVFHNLSPGAPHVTRFCEKVAYFYLCSYGTSGQNMILRNFTLWKFPRGITWLVGKQTNLLKMGVDKFFYSNSALPVWLSSQIERRDEVRVCHELYELVKTESILVPLHCFYCHKVWRLILKNMLVFLNMLSVKSSN